MDAVIFLCRHYHYCSQFASGSSYCSVYGVQGSYRSQVYATGACIASDGGSFQLSCSGKISHPQVAH